MTARFGVNELHVEAHAVSAALHAALEDIADVQLAPDRLRVERLAFVGERRIAGDDVSAPNARKIGRQALGDPVDEMLLVRVAADIGERQDDHREARRGGFFGYRGRSRLRLGGLAHVQRIDPDRLGDVLELRGAEVADSEIEPPVHLAIRVLRQADRTGPADALQTRGDIDAVAHQITVGLLDDIAQMNADAELDAAFWRHAAVAFNEAVLHLDGAAHRVDNAAELDKAAVARALDDASVMRGDGGVDQIAAQPPKPRQGAVYVRAGEPAVADDVGDKERCEF